MKRKLFYVLYLLFGGIGFVFLGISIVRGIQAVWIWLLIFFTFAGFSRYFYSLSKGAQEPAEEIEKELPDEADKAKQLEGIRDASKAAAQRYLERPDLFRN